jgi:hypothetical protein
MALNFSLSQSNDELAVLTGVGTFASTYLLGHEPISTAIGLAVLGALGVLGVTSVSATGAPAPVTSP